MRYYDFTRRAFGALTLVGMLTLGSQIACAENGVTENEILVGALGPLTGATAFVGGPARDGLTLAFDAINARGGVNGRKLKLIFEQALTPAESVAAAKKLVESDRVAVLVLASGSTGAAAVASYVRQTGVPTYNIAGATPIIREPFARNIFHGAVTEAAHSSGVLIGRIDNYVKAPRRVGVLVGTYAFPQAELKGVQDNLRGHAEEIAVEQFDQGARDFTSQLLSFTRKRINSVVILGDFSEAGYAIKQAPEKGLVGITWILAGTAATDGIIPILGSENSKNIWSYSTTPTFPMQPHPTSKKFLELWSARYGRPPQGRPNLYDMIGYGSAYVLAEAIEKAGRDLTRERLISAWETLVEAKPSLMGGVDVIYPESYTEADHQGNKVRGQATIRDGMWQVVD
ncbi:MULTISPECIES: ABC transporter substrate-binding protein [unclassified Beijerinckia]|uniref:ABC transporter substrate-binding protein n=1 Tax=unclassified Beijerinckia TaxID=2638183 RepID=UPI00089C81A4|nr:MULTISPECIES: ABC transporter substrate-binding protein [unclassified Beijerinckia]MDH7799268.1 branched-chain amino acid transport system substrate-binding protein [Beijerinckia sp. GAS462]SED90148.1 amino acid/amide ABC transporter substrate-binding protein, HAAT family [Beijerinckia sp. 28-YEA-48]